MVRRAFRWLIRALPFMAMGAVGTVWLVSLSPPEDWGTSYATCCAILGAAIGVHLWWGGQGVMAALRSGDARHVLLWAVVGAFAGALMGYFAWHDPSGPPLFPPILLSGGVYQAMLRCAIFFALCSAVGYGYERTQDSSTLPQP